MKQNTAAKETENKEQKEYGKKISCACFQNSRRVHPKTVIRERTVDLISKTCCATTVSALIQSDCIIKQNLFSSQEIKVNSVRSLITVLGWTLLEF